MKLFELTKALMKIPSVSGEEQETGNFLGEYLRSLGYEVELQCVEDGRKNVSACLRHDPQVFLTTP